MHVRSIVNNIRELNWLKTRSVLLGVKLNNRSKKRLRTFSNANSAKLSPEASGSGSRPSCGRLSLGLGLGMKGLGLVSELRVSAQYWYRFRTVRPRAYPWLSVRLQLFL